MKKTDDELIADWLQTNQPKQFAEADKVYEPYTGPLTPTNLHTKAEFDPKSTKRIYRFLNKTPLSDILDETKRNYGN